jgi:hypothetical protein
MRLRVSPRPCSCRGHAALILYFGLSQSPLSLSKRGRELILGPLGLLFWQAAETSGRIRLLASRD